MWNTVISIDKSYSKEFAYLTGELSKLKYSSFAYQESKKRYFIDIACEREHCAATVNEIIRIVSNVILIYFKARYFKGRLRCNLPFDGEISNAMSILISALVYFDVGIEANILRDKITACHEYAIDGMFLFQMSELQQNWDELCVLSASLLSPSAKDTDIYNLTAFLIDASNAKKNKILIEGGSDQMPSKVFNMTTNKMVFVHNLFDSFEQNLLSAIIGEYPKEIYLNDNTTEKIFKELGQVVSLRRMQPAAQ